MEKRLRDKGDEALTLDDIPDMAASFHNGMDDDPISRAARELLAARRSQEGGAEETITTDLPAKIVGQALSASQIDVDPRSPMGVVDVAGNLGLSAETRAILERVVTSEVVNPESTDPENASDIAPIAAELEAFDRIFKQSPNVPDVRGSAPARDESSIAFGNFGKPVTPARNESESSAIVHAVGRHGDRHEIDDLVYRPDERKPGTGVQLLSALRVPASSEPASPAPLLQLDPSSTPELNSDEQPSQFQSVSAPQEPGPLGMTRPIVLVDLDQSNRFYEAALDEFAERIDALAQAHAKDALEYFKWELTAEMRALEGFY